jgi:hypothetical protein
VRHGRLEVSPSHPLGLASSRAAGSGAVRCAHNSAACQGGCYLLFVSSSPSVPRDVRPDFREREPTGGRKRTVSRCFSRHLGHRPARRVITDANRTAPRTYGLVIRQQPRHARVSHVGGACGPEYRRPARGAADAQRAVTYRRLIDPPVVVQLVVDEQDTSAAGMPRYFLFAALVRADTDEAVLWTEVCRSLPTSGSAVLMWALVQDGRECSTTGALVSSLFRLRDPEHADADAGLFVLPDVAVRCEGAFRLRLTLFELDRCAARAAPDSRSRLTAAQTGHATARAPTREHVHGAVHGLRVARVPRHRGCAPRADTSVRADGTARPESTALSCALAAQGVKLRVRKTVRGHQRPETAPANSSSASPRVAALAHAPLPVHMEEPPEKRMRPAHAPAGGLVAPAPASAEGPSVGVQAPVDAHAAASMPYGYPYAMPPPVYPYGYAPWTAYYYPWYAPPPPPAHEPPTPRGMYAYMPYAYLPPPPPPPPLPPLGRTPESAETGPREGARDTPVGRCASTLRIANLLNE